MGTQVFSEDTETDAESIIKYTRQPKKPPPYVPRSRSLGDLPGGLRVPIIKKQESRLHQKHEANIAGLEELKMLRHRHEQMVEDVKTTVATHETSPRRSCPLRVSSSLACIKEEPGNQNGSHESSKNPDIYASRSRFSISSNESHHDTSTQSNSGSSSIESLNQSFTETDNQQEVETRTREQILADFRRNFEQTYGGSTNQLRRRASIQVVSLSNQLAPPVDMTIRPKLRRASFQCEAVLTKKFEREEPVSKVISDFKLQYNFPSPLHAVTRQYGSSTDIRLQDKTEPSPSPATEKDLKTILKEWQNQKTTQASTITSQKSIPKQQKDVCNPGPNAEVNTTRHARNPSLTSDYFGSTETLNTVNSCPLHNAGSEIKFARRQSLPVILTRPDNLAETAPKLPERRRSFLDKDFSKINNLSRKTANMQDNVSIPYKHTTPEPDDGIFHEEDLVKQNSIEQETPVPKIPERRKQSYNASSKTPLNSNLQEQTCNQQKQPTNNVQQTCVKTEEVCPIDVNKSFNSNTFSKATFSRETAV